jgi:integrase
MGHINKTPAGNFRANWRDPAGRQSSKTFATKREAAAYLAEIESTMSHGAYIDPRGGKIKMGAYTLRWLDARRTERTTAARERSIVRVHILPTSGEISLAKIDHLMVQAWVSKLVGQRAAATVVKVFNLTSAIFAAAVRDRLIAYNPCEGVKLPSRSVTGAGMQVLSRDQFARLLQQVPPRHRALVALAAGTGLRWGELMGLRGDAIDFDQATIRVVRTLTEVAGHVEVKACPKSRAGRRTVPVPTFAMAELRRHVKEYGTSADGVIFANTSGGPVLRGLFRNRVWRPALVRAGLLGDIVQLGPDSWRGMWEDKDDTTLYKEFTSEREAVAHVAQHCAGAYPRFHDLRHSFATWLVSDGVPINDVSKVMGHAQTSTTLNRYTHPSPTYENRVRRVFDDFPLTPPPE